jgi:hypothetical protein
VKPIVSLYPRGSPGKQVSDHSRKIGRVHDRTIQKYGTGELIIPVGVLAVNGHFIPVNTMTRATVWPWMPRIGLKPATQFLCEQVVLIPVLQSSWVR